jgi:hypothetical protein
VAAQTPPGGVGTLSIAPGLFTGVRGIGFLRTSPFGDSEKFAYTEF